jgi:3-dehydroquinate synthase
MNTVHVNLGPRSYDVAVVSDQMGEFGAFARARCHGAVAFIVHDNHVVNYAGDAAQVLAAAGFHVEKFQLPAGDPQKALAGVSQVYDALAGLPADRRTLIVAVGGGVIGDLAGFVAATYNRGLPLLMVPTTLLAMVDSSVGGKVGVNHPRGKNLIGAFHQPVGVWIDTTALATLPDREYRSGLAEVVKYGVILDADFFSWLETQVEPIQRRDAGTVRHIVSRCCELKARVVEQDEREETGLRAVLNYGHTFAHAFETVGGYGAWLHGEAVAAGMVCASRLAERRGLIPAELTMRQVRLLQALGLPIGPLTWPVAELLETMRTDKKCIAGRLRFILPRRLGQVAAVDDVPEDDVRAILEAANQ